MSLKSSEEEGEDVRLFAELRGTNEGKVDLQKESGGRGRGRGVFSTHLVTRGQISLKYFSRYFGKRVAKELSSRSGAFMSSFVHVSTFQ
jgi:hypothetical protein